MSVPIPSFAASLVRVAVSQIGAQERAQHDNRGAAIEKYHQATDLSGTGWPWCAAFVDWCFQTAVVDHPEVRAHAPHTAAAFGLVTWADEQDLLILRPGGTLPFRPEPGDIVVYAFSHCGIVVAPKTAGVFEAVEGNTNPAGGRDGYEVARRVRGINVVRAFLRLPAPHAAASAA